MRLRIPSLIDRPLTIDLQTVPLGLVRDGDIIEIDIPARSINVRLIPEELDARRRQELSKGKDAFTPANRNRIISKALRAYAAGVTSADKGGVRL